MRIGLLECDHVQERYLPIAGDYADMFTAMVAVADRSAEVVRYDARDGVPPRASRGVRRLAPHRLRASVYDDEPWIEPLAGLRASGPRPRCRASGSASVTSCSPMPWEGAPSGPAGWGVGALDDLLDHAWMEPALPTRTLLYSHQDQVTALPPDGRPLAPPTAPSPCSPIGDDIIGIQAHPEFGTPYVRALLEDRADRIGGPRRPPPSPRSQPPPTSGPRPAGSSPFLRAGCADLGRGGRAPQGTRDGRSLRFPLDRSDIGATVEVSDPSPG